MSAIQIRNENPADHEAITAVTRAALADVPPVYFLALSLAGPAARGEVSFHPAFAASS